MGQKITPFFWFEWNAEDAANYYVSLFENSGIDEIQRSPEGVPGHTPGSVMVVKFHLGDQQFTALNGGPYYEFSSATSFVIDCKSQDEVDHFWNSFADGGKPQACGWIVDRFGVTWQVTPSRLIELMNDPDPVKAQRVVQAMLQMEKLDVPALERAYRGE